MGNLRSVQKAFERVGAKALVTQDPSIIKRSEKVVLPGVGAMKPAIEKLNANGMTQAINEAISAGKPFLGICLGLQLLFEESSEGGSVKGLGIIKGSVERFKSLKVPHMGWNQLQIKNTKCPLFKNIADQSHVYFCHSYFVKPKNAQAASTITDYGVEFTSSVWQNNVFGVQFHPEKSQDTGLTILKNFVELKI